MVIIPYKSDTRLSRLPVLSILVCLVCLFIYFLQHQSNQKIDQFTADYCSTKQTRILKHVFEKTTFRGRSVGCFELLSRVTAAPDHDEMLNSFAKSSKRFKSLSNKASEKLVGKELRRFYESYSISAPEDMTVNYWYHPSSWSLPHMITSAFAHGDWSHVIGNVFFFFAFAATVEIVLGSILYIVFFLTIAFSTSALYSLHSIAVGSLVPTLGLSGVVYGFMGVLLFLAPSINIRHIFWFFLLFWRVYRFSIPVWMLVIFYVGFDAYKLIATEDWQGINLIAHVGGGVVGYLFGFLFLRNKKNEITKELRNYQRYQ